MSRTSIHTEGENLELELFRRQWQQEISRQKSGEDSSEDVHSKGKLLYQRAEKAESQGDLPKAVRLYRQAFKLCPDLDSGQYLESSEKSKSKKDFSQKDVKKKGRGR